MSRETLAYISEANLYVLNGNMGSVSLTVETKLNEVC